jgi:hypothetical protein
MSKTTTSSVTVSRCEKCGKLVGQNLGYVNMCECTPSTRSHQSEELLRLAERCEKASAGTWSRSEEVCRALAGPNGNYAMRDVTQSIDAAMTLVPEGWRWVMRQANADESKGKFFARLETGDFKSITWGKGCDYITDVVSGQDVFVWAATPALALTAAALRARASTPPEGHKPITSEDHHE